MIKNVQWKESSFAPVLKYFISGHHTGDVEQGIHGLQGLRRLLLPAVLEREDGIPQRRNGEGGAENRFLFFKNWFRIH